MAEKFGSCAESLSQKRSWVDCQSPGEKSHTSGDCNTLEPPLLFPKRSRSEEEFIKKGQLQTSSYSVDEPGCDMSGSNCLAGVSYQSDTSQLSKDERQKTASFTIGPREVEGI